MRVVISRDRNKSERFLVSKINYISGNQRSRGAGVMIQWLRIFDSLPEDLGWRASIHTGPHNRLNSSSGEYHNFWPGRAPGTHVVPGHTSRQNYQIHTFLLEMSGLYGSQELEEEI